MIVKGKEHKAMILIMSYNINLIKFLMNIIIEYLITLILYQLSYNSFTMKYYEFYIANISLNSITIVLCIITLITFMYLIFRCECNKKIEISMPDLVEKNICEERNIYEERNNLVNLSILLTNSTNNNSLNSNPQDSKYVTIDFLTT